MGLCSFNFVQWPPKETSFLHQSAFWPFKVVQGHPRSMILVPIESAYDFLLVRHCDYVAILHRFSDTATYWLKIAYFSYPSLIRRPCSLCSLWNFALKLTVRKLQSWSIYVKVFIMIVAWVVLTQCQRVTDRRTDGRTDGRIYYS